MNVIIDYAKIAVIGLGYVGLPLAIEFGKKYKTIGFDVNQSRINELKTGHDFTLEVSKEELLSANKLKYSANSDEIKDCNIYIVTVPTPINDHKQPDLTPLEKASTLLGKVLKQDDIVIYESTVYPGATEEVCVPILEQVSGLVFNQGFFVGYSPERINPGDKKHRVTNILKVTSGSTEEIAEYVDQLYKSIIIAGTYKASSIKVAEAAKVIENTQREVNIALINELAVIFNYLGIDTEEVLLAAGTKWNFLPFRPGLIGGHCIGIDSYYLTYKAQAMGCNPAIILSSRRINDEMGEYVVSRLIKLMLNNSIEVKNADILILGFTFKENCPDLRNTRVFNIVKELKTYKVNVHVYDPWANPEEALNEYGIVIMQSLDNAKYDAILLAVAHEEFKKMDVEVINELGKPSSVIYDLKYIFPVELTDERL